MRKHVFYKWSDLTDQQKSENTEKTEVLFSFCEKNPGITVTYEQMNKMGLNHLYHFKVDKYNELSDHEMIVDDMGCRCAY